MITLRWCNAALNLIFTSLRVGIRVSLYLMKYLSKFCLTTFKLLIRCGYCTRCLFNENIIALQNSSSLNFVLCTCQKKFYFYLFIQPFGSSYKALTLLNLNFLQKQCLVINHSEFSFEDFFAFSLEWSHFFHVIT